MSVKTELTVDRVWKGKINRSYSTLKNREKKTERKLNRASGTLNNLKVTNKNIPGISEGRRENMRQARYFKK